MNIPELNMADIKNSLNPTEEEVVQPKLPAGVLKLPPKGANLKIKLSGEGVKVKFQKRSRDRMKFQIKFSSEEAESFRNYSSVFKDDEMHMDDFIKFLFFTGMNAYNERVQAAAAQAQNDPEVLSKLGLDLPETQENATTEESS